MDLFRQYIKNNFCLIYEFKLILLASAILKRSWNKWYLVIFP